MDNLEQTLYEILRISQNATLAEIKIAYRKMVMEYHPDTNPDKNNETCHKMMCKINEAYGILRNPKLREIYDKMLFEKGQYVVPNEENSTSSTTQEKDFYESESSDYSEEQKTNSKRQKEAYKRAYKPNTKRYNYYNEIDFDEYMQKEFVEWLENFSYFYQYFAFNYYKKLNIDKDSILEELYESFENIIDYEKQILKKNGKSLNL